MKDIKRPVSYDKNKQQIVDAEGNDISPIVTADNEAMDYFGELVANVINSSYSVDVEKAAEEYANRNFHYTGNGGKDAIAHEKCKQAFIAGSKISSQNWIDAIEKPNDDRRVIVKNKYFTSIVPHFYQHNGWLTYDNSEPLTDITHWMEYPA